MDESIRFVSAMIDAGAELDGDVLELTATSWAVHARIAVDGVAILAEFDSIERARSLIERLTDVHGLSQQTGTTAGPNGST